MDGRNLACRETRYSLVLTCSWSAIGFGTDPILKITSKLWNTHHHPKNVEEALNKTLKDLQTDYLDLYLVRPVSRLLEEGSLTNFRFTGPSHSSTQMKHSLRLTLQRNASVSQMCLQLTLGRCWKGSSKRVRSGVSVSAISPSKSSRNCSKQQRSLLLSTRLRLTHTSSSPSLLSTPKTRISSQSPIVLSETTFIMHLGIPLSFQ